MDRTEKEVWATTRCGDPAFRYRSQKRSVVACRTVYHTASPLSMLGCACAKTSLPGIWPHDWKSRFSCVEHVGKRSPKRRTGCAKIGLRESIQCRHKQGAQQSVPCIPSLLTVDRRNLLFGPPKLPQPSRTRRRCGSYGTPLAQPSEPSTVER